MCGALYAHQCAADGSRRVSLVLHSLISLVCVLHRSRCPPSLKLSPHSMWFKWPAAPKASLQVCDTFFWSECSFIQWHALMLNLTMLSFVAVTVEGKIYACGEATNGRLGLGLSSGTIPIPRQITALSNYVVKKVAVHSGGRHAMALTVDGKVFSWGEGDDGKLGHFSRMYVILRRNCSDLRDAHISFLYLPSNIDILNWSWSIFHLTVFLDSLDFDSCAVGSHWCSVMEELFWRCLDFLS